MLLRAPAKLLVRWLRREQRTHLTFLEVFAFNDFHAMLFLSV